MTDPINALMADTGLIAITVRQTLAPVEDRDVPIFPPTYPMADGQRTHHRGTPYTVNDTPHGTLVCDLDSVQSQANRMEAAFTGALADVVPQHVVAAGDAHQVNLLALPHRIADAAIRATALEERIKDCFEAFAAGDAAPLARLAPTSLVYGAWDSRGTRIGIARAVRGCIRAFDVSVLTRSAQFSGALPSEVFEGGKRSAKKGSAPTPVIDTPGGVLVRGEIVHSASVRVRALRRYGAGAHDALPAYLLGLALGGLVHAMRDYDLRSGCLLVAHGPARWRAVRDDHTGADLAMDADALVDSIRGVARAWADTASVTLGGVPEVHAFCPERATRAKRRGSEQ